MKHLNPECSFVEIGTGNCPKCNPVHSPQPQEDWEIRVGMLRQWLNEDRGCKPMVTNDDLKYWLKLPEVIEKAKKEEREEVIKVALNMKIGGFMFTDDYEKSNTVNDKRDGYNEALSDIITKLKEKN